MIRCSAPGKLILLGEYSVLFGSPALVTAVDRFARVTLAPARDFTLRALGTTVSATHSQALVKQNPKFKLVAAILDEVLMPSSLPTVHISIDTQDFYHGTNKLGLGSSAAISVALTEALKIHLGDENRTAPDLFKAAYRAHRAAQDGQGSGIDIAASAFGGVFSYRAPVGESAEPREIALLEWPVDLHWQAYWTGRSASTPTFIDAVERYRAAQPKTAHEIFGRLSESATEGISSFRSGESEKYIKSVKRFSRALESLGKSANVPIMTAEHRRLAAVASALGAVYKPSGAGGGDIGVAFSQEPLPDATETLRLNRFPHKESA